MKTITRRNLFCIVFAFLVFCIALVFLTVDTPKAYAETESAPFTIIGETSSKEYCSGDYTNERVKIIITDSIYTRLYYKSPLGNSYTYTKNGYWVTNAANGLFKFYATTEDGHKSIEGTIYFDNKNPEGKIYSNGNSVDSVKISRGIQASSIAACFPFVSNAIEDNNGILLGENKLPAFVDFFKRNAEYVNSNMVIIGKSGSGKSYATKTILTHLASCNAKIFVLDPEGEYLNLTQKLHGKVLDVASSRHGKLNPFQIISSLDDENDDGTRNSFFTHLQFLEEFYRIILAGINPDSLELLNKLTVEAYERKGITSTTDLMKLKPKDYPVFDDLYSLITEKLGSVKDDYDKDCLKVVENYIAKFKKGGRNSNLWNGKSDFRTDENFVCFDFQKLLANKNGSIANAQMLLVLKYLENEVIKNRDYNLKNGTDRKIVVVVDEAHLFIDEKYPVALDFMYQLAKRIRKYDGMEIVITQSIKDFAGTPETARKSMAIINVSQYSLIFPLSPNDMSDLCALYEKAGQINEIEADNIVHNERGCAFLISSPQSRTNIRIVATPYFEKMFGG